VCARIILSGLFVTLLAADTTAQNRIRWRPGAILEGLADTVQMVARDIGDRDSPDPPDADSENGVIGIQAHRDDPQHAHHARPPRQTHRPQATRAASIDDVIQMVHRGLGESTIVRYINDNGVKQHLSVSDLFRLHEDGVSEPIIIAMQTARVYDVESDAHPVLPVTKGPPPRSDLRSFKPSRPAVNIEQFGPSILAPPQPPAVETLAPKRAAISPP
jgi:hypothetical protein